jgi:hypothetical protein
LFVSPRQAKEDFLGAILSQPDWNALADEIANQGLPIAKHQSREPRLATWANIGSARNWVDHATPNGKFRRTKAR